VMGGEGVEVAEGVWGRYKNARNYTYPSAG
jgi:hypothetical protein